VLAVFYRETLRRVSPLHRSAEVMSGRPVPRPLPWYMPRSRRATSVNAARGSPRIVERLQPPAITLPLVSGRAGCPLSISWARLATAPLPRSYQRACRVVDCTTDRVRNEPRLPALMWGGRPSRVFRGERSELGPALSSAGLNCTMAASKSNLALAVAHLNRRHSSRVVRARALLRRV